MINGWHWCSFKRINHTQGTTCWCNCFNCTYWNRYGDDLHAKREGDSAAFKDKLKTINFGRVPGGGRDSKR